MTWRGVTTVPDRIFACLPYLLPLMEGMSFGRFLFQQFPVLQFAFIPLFPILQIYASIPFAGLIIFIVLLVAVVRNLKINHFIRFNTMQAILLDIGLILVSLVFRLLSPALGNLFIQETLSNVIFLGIVAACVYSIVQSLRGHYAEIPTISDAVYLQVPS